VMSSYSETCLDSSVLVRAVDPTPQPEVRSLFRGWLRDKVMLHAPALLRYEVVNALHQIRKAGRLSGDRVELALREALGKPIVLHEDDNLHARALEMAADHKLPAAYDGQYLALAEKLGVELWTADAKLVRAVQDRLAWVRLVS
jgi:predicted nucleic acid-binding protein